MNGGTISFFSQFWRNVVAAGLDALCVQPWRHGASPRRMRMRNTIRGPKWRDRGAERRGAGRAAVRWARWARSVPALRRPAASHRVAPERRLDGPARSAGGPRAGAARRPRGRTLTTPRRPRWQGARPARSRRPTRLAGPRRVPGGQQSPGGGRASRAARHCAAFARRQLTTATAAAQ